MADGVDLAISFWIPPQHDVREGSLFYGGRRERQLHHHQFKTVGVCESLHFLNRFYRPIVTGNIGVKRHTDDP